MRKVLKISFLVLVISQLPTCTARFEPAEGKVFRYNESKGVVSLDPAFARNQATIWPVAQIFNGLLQTDSSLNIKPCIAKSFSISPNGREYIFNLRTDVFFHNHPLFPQGIGRKVTASDFVFTFNRLIDPAVASPGAWVLQILDKNRGKTGLESLNDSTLIIYLREAFSPFPGLLTMPYCFVVPHEIVSFYGRDFRSNPVGTGPFFLKLWAEGEKMILRRNPKYFELDHNGTRLPKIEAVAITFVADKQSEFLEFIKGRIHFISGINASFKDELITASGNLQPKYSNRLQMLRSPYLNTEYLGFMINPLIMPNNPLLNKHLRQAINLSINRQKLTAYLRNNIGIPANAGIIPQGMASFSPDMVKGFEYNPDSARKLIALAGYPDGKGLKPIKITTVADYLDICEFIQHELMQTGITVEIEVVTGLAYREMIANGKMQMFRASWIADYADAENYLALFYSPNFSPAGPNYTYFKNSEFDVLYQKAKSETNENKRIRMYQKMENMILDEAVIVPLFYDEAVRFVQKEVTNLGINPLNMLDLKFVDIAE